MGKEQRYDIYDLFLKYPDPLVPRRWRVGVRERITRDGEVRVPLDVPAVRRTVGNLVRQGVEAVAVCFLHAYRNPAHEQLVKTLLEREFPQLSVSVSSEISPEIREYERTSTTVCNAYVQPLVDHYLRGMETALAADGFRGRFLLMLSSGTLAAPDVARRFPVRLLESGPAAGALLAGHIGSLIGQPDLVGFDMGGTTAKICLVRDGRPKVTPTIEVARVHRFKPGSGLPVKTPVVDMIEIGAGGGSLAGVESMGQAARLYLIERGQDPRRFALVGFGGAGPAAAARVARLLGMRQAIIPPASGLASALGLLVAPAGFDFGHSLTGELQSLNWDEVERLFVQMEDRGREMVLATGIPASSVRAERRAEMRYKGQFHDIEVPLPERLHHGVV